jgi:hypothetical protein
LDFAPSKKQSFFGVHFVHGNKKEMTNIGDMTDMEHVISLIGHIENPCFFPRNSEEYLALRQSYIIAVQEIGLLNIANPHAKKLLEDTIKKYELKN